MTAEIVKRQLLSFGNPGKADHSRYFFKTGKGQYGEGDRFIGVTVPESRSVAKANKNLSFDELKKLLDDDYHECRFCALIILADQFKKADNAGRKEIFEFYLANTRGINNWDLVDVSSYSIVGEWLLDNDRSVLYQLAESANLWEQRISIISTLAFIRKNDFADTLKLSEKFLTHRHDLMHKACGWMLREAGKRDEKTLTYFLDKHCTQMPRTMLRYAIEKLSPEQKTHYLTKKIRN
ncbi:MAG: DNA alkylation repair protein [Petrimonas sp.]|uniref:DNA alkylation repair protein n=1 Tax=Petrimonas sp. TaxID=2023866 RepID=UPI002B3A904C|nr:DNA alkylation repair protein [Petrimonas sp.]